MRRAALAVVAAAAMAAPASPAVAQAREEFVAAADAICTAGRDAAADLGAPPAAKAAYQRWFERSVALLEADVTKLRKLSPAPADAAAVGALLTQLDAAVVKARVAVPLVSKGTRVEFGAAYLDYQRELHAAESQARQLGLRVCGAAPAAVAEPGAGAGELLVEPEPEADVALAAMTSKEVPERRQDEGAWGKRDDIATGGTVPVAVSCVLAAFGVDPGPAKVADELKARGAWTPGQSSSWSGVADHIRGLGLLANEVTVAAVVEQLGVETDADGAAPAPVLVAWRHPSDGDGDGERKGQSTEGALVLAGYDDDKGEFVAVDPTRGRVEIAFDDLLEGDPWFLAVTRP